MMQRKKQYYTMAVLTQEILFEAFERRKQEKGCLHCDVNDDRKEAPYSVGRFHSNEDYKSKTA